MPLDGIQLTEEERKCIENAVTGIRLAARIVDTPCNEMTVDDFLMVSLRYLNYILYDL